MAAPFFHPQLAQVKHDHRTAGGELIRPIIEITGYPAALKRCLASTNHPVVVSDGAASNANGVAADVWQP